MDAGQEQGSDPGLEPTTRFHAGRPYVGRVGKRAPSAFSHERSLDRLLMELSRSFGPQRWWPAKTPFEVIVGAVLTQNTAWTNVERALEELQRRIPLRPERLLRLRPSELAQAIRSSGTYRVKAERLRAVSEWYVKQGGGTALGERPLAALRDELLGVRGIGPETADAILCYAGGRRTVVVDTYARRLLGRHGFVDPELPYEEVRSWLLERLIDSQPVLEEFHALAVRVGYDFCKPVARCDGCPATTPAPPRAGL